MAKKINVLQVGPTNWGETIPMIHENGELDWDYLNNMQVKEEMLEKIQAKKRTYNAVIFSGQVEKSLFQCIKNQIEAYGLIVDQHFQMDDWLSDIEQLKRPFYLNFSNPEEIVKTIQENFFSGQMGSKLHTPTVVVNPNFNGITHLEGEAYLELAGNFSELASQQLLTWQYNVGMYQQSKKIWLEFSHSDEVEVTMEVAKIIEGTDRISEILSLSEAQFRQGFDVDYDGKIGYLSISLRVKGEGNLKVGSLHFRDTRHVYGEFILGGQKISDEQNQELFYYFNPGDLKPPLTVYFSGYRSAEGFEGFFMMKSLGTPFLLITDPRLEGGAFYMGSHEIEEKLIQVIRNTLSNLNFNKNDLILSGLSMGTYGSLYYAAKLMPSDVIIGKPLASVGTIATNETLIRPGGFPTSFDILNSLMGDLSQNSAKGLDNHFWKTFEKGNYSETEFIISYMKNDDYDGNAYPKITQLLSTREGTVIGKGIPGRHNDNSQAINQWFINQYKRVLNEKFNRKV